MPVVAVINRKGGSGKSTIATHLAAWCANNSISVMLGDIDRQQSTRTWLRLRDPEFPPIAPWAMDNRNMLKPPTGVTHVVLDTPGGLHGLELARVVMFTDVILMPVCDSVFDRESAAMCFAELKNLPRVASGRCKVGVIAMRMENLTTSLQNMRSWAQAQGNLPVIGALHDSRVYVRCAEEGLTIFDLPRAEVAQDLAQWQPLLDWLSPLLLPQASPVISAPVPASWASHRQALGTAPLPASPLPTKPAVPFAPALRQPLKAATNPMSAPAPVSSASPASRDLSGLIPRFLQKPTLPGA